MHNAVVAAPRAQEAAIPRYGADTTVVTAQRAHELALGGIPDLKVTRVRANTEKCAISRPLDAGYAIARPDVAKLGDLAREGRPEVNTGSETDSEDILC